MFEFHDWATIRFSPENRDCEDQDALQAAAVKRVQEFVRQMGWQPGGNYVVDARFVNGDLHVWVAGLRNHAGIGEDVLALFRYIADIAPGSYGLLYTHDDEDPAQKIQLITTSFGSTF